MTSSSETRGYPGERLGLPESGPRSIARPGRRIAALAIDYAATVLLSAAFFEYSNLSIVLIFLAIQIVFIPTIGGSPGHRILGMRVVRADGAWTGVWRPIVRSLLLVIVIPAVVWDPDQRGLHDKAAGTVLIRS